MRNFKKPERQVIDLGRASVQTKGAAGFEIDVSGGKLRYLTGIASD